MADPLSLYVHIPFCTAKCSYCDFNSYANHEHLIPSYTETIVHEAQLWQRTTADRPFETVFFGGGTPSLMPLEELSMILNGLRAAFEIAPDAEVSLEANPNSLDEAYLGGLLDLGFNRLSIGVQSFHDDELRAIDRLHSADEARAAFRAARAAGFENVNLDLMFGLPEQPIERWQESVEEALALGPEHLSLYALTVEEGTPLARDVDRGRTPAPDPDNQASHYEWTRARLADAGYEHYEISNWARAGRRCAHNLTYWQNREYLGLGAGAHSYLDGVRFAVVAAPTQHMTLVDQSWREANENDGAARMQHLVAGEQITPQLAMSDELILGLRVLDGVSRERFRERYGIEMMDAFADQLAEPIALGLVELNDERLRLTERGLLLSNEVFVRLLPDG
ncbi:MAG: radical SAM family heme chaperone HemW [Dehalococcoidia bacterium]